MLVNTFIRRLRSRTGKQISGLTAAAMERFIDYTWPGNVRELKSALEFAFVISESGLIDLHQLPPKIIESLPDGSTAGPIPSTIVQSTDSVHRLPTTYRLEEPAEKTALIAALRQTNGNQSQAARVLGINRVTVWNRMKKYGIDLKRVLSI